MIPSYRTLAHLLAPACVVLLAACASTSSTAGPGADPNLVTADQIPDGQFNSALEVVQSMRPRWMRTRPNVNLGNELAQTMVYVDNVRQGGVEALESISAEAVERMEWIDATTATQRWGTGNSMGAIAVTTRRGG